MRINYVAVRYIRININKISLKVSRANHMRVNTVEVDRTNGIFGSLIQYISDCGGECI